MLQFQINLNRRDEYFCAPTILVSDEETNKKYPIILPDNLNIKDAMNWLQSVLPVMCSHKTIESLLEYF